MKKAQGEIITTILIILLVLAAIVIVWQVVNRTVTKGGEEIDSQAKCLGFTITLDVAADGTVNGRPSKEITAWNVYHDGASLTNGGAVAIGSSFSSGTSKALDGEKITASGTVDGQICPGMNEVIAEVA